MIYDFENFHFLMAALLGGRMGSIIHILAAGEDYFMDLALANCGSDLIGSADLHNCDYL